MTDERQSGAGTTSAGFAVLWVAIKREPWIFGVSTIGSLLFGALTVADAWVLGWATDHVVLPAFRDGAGVWRSRVAPSAIDLHATANFILSRMSEGRTPEAPAGATELNMDEILGGFGAAMMRSTLLSPPPPYSLGSMQNAIPAL